MAAILGITGLLPVLLITNPWSAILRADARILEAPPFGALLYPFSWVDYFLLVYACAAVTYSALLLASQWHREHRAHRFQTGVILVSIALPMFGVIPVLAGYDGPGQRDITPFLFAASNVAVVWALLRGRLFNLTPVARAVVFDGMPDAVIVTDLDDLLVDANPAAIRLFRRAEGLVGSRIEDLLGGEDELRTAALVQEPGTSDARMRSGDRMVDLEVKVSILRDGTGGMRGRVVLIRDVTSEREAERTLRAAHDELDGHVKERTKELELAIESLVAEVAERKRAEKAVKANETKFRAIFEQTFELTGMTTTDGTLVAANRAALDFIGADEADVIGKYLWETPWWAHSVDERNRLRDAVAEAAAGHFVRYNTTHPAPDGSVRHIDFSLKPAGSREGVVDMIVCEGRDIDEHVRAVEKLAANEARLRTIFDSATDAIFLMRGDVFIECNRATLVLFGCAQEEIVGRTPLDFSPPRQPDGAPSAESALERIAAALSGTPQSFEWKHIKKDGTEFDAEVSLNRVILRDEPHLQAIVRDVTQRKRAERERIALQEQLSHAQKMESIGRLAGGVAHDFNNLLTAILGHASLARLDMSEDDPTLEHIAAIEAAGMSAAALTRQLLAFSRKEVASPTNLDINEVVRSTQKLLTRLIGEDVTLQVKTDAAEGTVRVDRGHVEQILVNLAVNARDAMPKGGTLRITTSNIVLGDRGETVPAGAYVVLAVADTGTGMSPEVRQRIFEPFFTTKVVGKGTGLGLATVLEIVKQADGHIEVETEPDVGTSLRVYLPLCGDGTESAIGTEFVEDTPRTGGETVMLVEDHPDVRGLMERCLVRLGYRVFCFGRADEAVTWAREGGMMVDLLITDVVMPTMSGVDVAKAIRESHPEATVLHISGYPEDAIVHHGVLAPGVNFLAKPFTPQVLAGEIRRLLSRQVDHGVRANPHPVG